MVAGKLWGSDQGALTGSLTCAVNIKDEQAMAGTVNEPAEVVPAEAMLAEVMAKLLAQGAQTGPIDVRQQAAVGGAMGHLVTPKERHERRGEGLQAVEERLERGLTTKRIAEEDGDEVDHVVGASATASEADMLPNVQDAALGEMVGQQDQFGEPGWDRRNIVRIGADLHERCRNHSHMHLLRRKSRNLLHRSIVAEIDETYRLSRSSLRISWEPPTLNRPPQPFRKDVYPSAAHSLVIQTMRTPAASNRPVYCGLCKWLP